MSIPGSASPFLLAQQQYRIQRSVRFNSIDSAYLSRTPSVAGNRKTWTWAGWIKYTYTSTSNQALFAAEAASPYNIFGITPAGALRFETISGASCVTASLLRDPSSWYHVVLAVDTTQVTASNRLKIYVNSALQSLSVATYPFAGEELLINNSQLQTIGRWNNQRYLNGYLADIHFIDGQALDPTSFGEFDANGVWQPKAYTGTYPGNSFHLDFADNSAATTAGIGKDVSGNGNDWTPVNLSVAAGAGNDSLVDTPTNYGVDDGLGGSVRGNYATLNPLDGSPGGLSNGNLDAASANAYPTIIPGSGQWYYEVNGTGYQWDGIRANWTPRAGSHNFGQRAWASSAPSGFKALCTTNLPAPVVAKPSEVMDVKLYTGNGSTQTISGLGFSPDFVWIKNRAQADNHKLLDTVRGATNELESNTTDAEVANTDGLTAFNSNGFVLGADVEYNTNAEAYVAWAWDAGSSTVTNTQGSITSQVRANPSAGFSIVTATYGANVNETIGHGLGVAPEFIITKNRTNATSWYCYHKFLGIDQYIILNSTAAAGSLSGSWGLTAPTSTVFGARSGLAFAQNENTVCYCFAPVAGYSSFGSYTGNGSADGPFVYTGFRPRWLLIKRTDGVAAWYLFDSERLGYNPNNELLYPNYSNAEANVQTYDLLSNGFKVRTLGTVNNASGGTYVWAAFAESPFQYARAR